nr:hypothetical protein [Tanacetum cinerariifolium]
VEACGGVLPFNKGDELVYGLSEQVLPQGDDEGACMVARWW